MIGFSRKHDALSKRELTKPIQNRLADSQVVTYLAAVLDLMAGSVLASSASEPQVTRA